jgi:hypothetical protein
MHFTLNQVVHIVIDALGLSPSCHAPVRARVQHLQRLDFPRGIKGGARGPRANYDEERLMKVALGFQLLDLGFTPARMKATIVQHWSEIRTTFAIAAVHREEALYLATYPNALNGFRDPIDKDEIAWIQCGLTLPQLAQMFAQRSVLDAPNYASLNLTGLLLSIATATGNLAGSKPAAIATANEFLSTLGSWK